MGKSKTPEERAAKEARKLGRLAKKNKKEVLLQVVNTVEESSVVASSPAPKSSETHADVALYELSGEKHTEEKKLSKKRRLEPEEEPTDPITPPESSEAPKKRKKQKRSETGELVDSSSMVVDEIPLTGSLRVVEEEAGASSRSRRKEKALKKDKKKGRGGEEEGNSVVQKAEERSAVHSTPDDEVSGPPLTSTDKKKDKKKKSKDAPLSPKKKKKYKSTSDSAEVEPPSLSKKRKNCTDFPDPHADESLNDQARKALEYAFVQFNDPPNWKFNKAKQNWLIRNVWSTEAIPDNYLPLTTKYLTQVQGGSRDKLRQACEAALSKPVPSTERTGDGTRDPQPSDSPGEASEGSVEPKPIIEPAKPVAGAIIASLERSVPVESKALRARLLSDALGFD